MPQVEYKVEIDLLSPLNEDVKLGENLDVLLEKTENGRKKYINAGLSASGNQGDAHIRILFNIEKLLDEPPGRLVIRFHKGLWDMGDRVNYEEGIGLIYAYKGLVEVGTPRKDLHLLATSFNGLAKDSKGYFRYPYFS